MNVNFVNIVQKLKTQFIRHLNTNKHKKRYIDIKTNDTINEKKKKKYIHLYKPAQIPKPPYKPAKPAKPAQIPILTSKHFDQHKTSTNQHKYTFLQILPKIIQIQR